MPRKYPPGFTVYEENIKMLSGIPDDQAGRIIKSVCTFYVTGEAEALADPLEDMVAESMRDKIARDFAQYASVCRQNSDNAKKRWKDET